VSEEIDVSSLPVPADTALLKEGDWVPSVNFNERRPTVDLCGAGEGKNPVVKIDLLLLHYTATPTNDYALQLLTTPEGGVSSHYLIDGQGRIIQIVAEKHRAWHAGEAEWAGEADINSCSIGIEIQNQGAALERVPAYGVAQMAAVTELCADIVKRHKIRPNRILGHSDVAPHRKQDPGAHFDWARLAKRGIGLWLDPNEFTDNKCPDLQEASLIDLQNKFVAIGYGLEITGELDQRTFQVITAFQRHYRPSRVDGKLDFQTIRLVDQLLEIIKNISA
jgi:N-acetylmuramoyl-L-alanine amidase